MTRIYKTSDPSFSFAWEENLVSRARLQEFDMPQIKFLSVPVDGGFEAAVKLQFPSEIDLEKPASNKKYAMIIRVYGGPGSSQVTSSFSLGMNKTF